MNINLDIIADALEDLGARSCTNDDLSFDVSGFALFSPSTDPSPSVAFVINVDEVSAKLARLPVNNWICCGEASEKELRRTLRANVVVLPRARASCELVVRIDRIYQDYLRWENDLALNALKKEPYGTVLSSIAYRALGNPFLLFNPYDLCVGSMGVLPDDFDNKEYLALVEGLETGVPAPSFRMSAHAEQSHEPEIFLKTNAYSLMVTNIFVDGTRYGKIVYCDAERPFTKGFKALARIFCSFMEMLTAIAIKQEELAAPEDSFITELLTKRHIDDRWFDYHLKQAGISTNVALRVIVSQARDIESSAVNRIYISAKLHSIPAVISSIPFRDFVVTVITGHDQLFTGGEFEKALKQVFPHHEVLHGISLRFYDLRFLKRFFQQGETALAAVREAAEDGTASPTVKYYDDTCFFKDFLKHYKIDIDSTWLIHPAVERLWEYDKANNTSNVLCLKTFIESGFNISDASKILFMHYNTLLYHLKRIEEIAGISYRDSHGVKSHLFQILLSCKLLLRQ